MSAPLDFVTGDDPVHCHLCGKDTSVAMIARHLVTEHGIDPQEIADATIVVEDESAASPDLFSWLRGELAESAEWIKGWREGQFDSGSRDAQGWPIEMHGVVADLERYERLWPLALDVWRAAEDLERWQDGSRPRRAAEHKLGEAVVAFREAAERERA